ncbi:hypothetical protein ABZ719_37630 [Streptomyces sp. NPDC006743]|uniref:hypothetical protein n=1 Tax=Streptomyces sp. NPDC006743 TaxID=3154480 RepID=UPI0034571A0D
MAEIIDYGRFRERLESVRPSGEADMAATGPRWELLREFQEQWGYVPTGGECREREAPDPHKEYLAGLKAAHQGGPEEDQPESVDPRIPVPAALDEWWDLPFNSFADRSERYETNPGWPPTVRHDPCSDYLSELTVFGRTREALGHLAQTLGVDWSDAVREPESRHC